MRIIYQETDITDFVQTRKCVARDTCGARCDSLEIEFENAGRWFRWQPEQDDTIRVTLDDYDTGRMFLNTVLPEDGRFRVLATGLPCAARRKTSRSFIGNTVEEIMRKCAVGTGMDFGLWGVEGDTLIPYWQQEDETCASALYRLLTLENAQIKCVSGRYAGIGIQWAQARAAARAFRVTARQPGAAYERTGEKLRALTVKTPWGQAAAEDANAPEKGPRAVMNLPARSAAQAARWARGMLTHLNRECECLTMTTRFDAALTAMARVDVTGGTDADGAWLVEDVEHDLINKRTRARMRRCMDGITGEGGQA